ncbi:MAG: HEPN domain-containing protein [Patescibacteria group bacterium]|nr:HEPN domain-containing protein [Patescibacteria group bacterium]
MRNKEAQQWMRKAKDDLLWTEANLREKIYYGACFTAQQAAEKALKAHLISTGKIPRKIHDLGALIEECGQADKSFESLRETILPLTDYSVQVRYPDIGDFIEYDEIKATDALLRAKNVLEFVKEKVKNPKTIF